MSTQAQILANQANSQYSTGPKSDAGKAASSKNNFRHGLTGPFAVLPWENQEEYTTLRNDLLTEHQPATATENILVTEMAQSYWLRQRAVTLQNLCFRSDQPAAGQPKELALYLRYQTTQDRAFYKALNQLLKLRADKRKQEIGFVSQGRRAADDVRRKRHEERREAQEIRSQQMHTARVWLVEAQAQRHETEKRIAELIKIPKMQQSNDPTGLAHAA